MQNSVKYGIPYYGIQDVTEWRLDVRICVSTAKAHSEQERVEAKIRIIRYTLDQLGTSAKAPLTAIGWEMLLAKIANCIDDTPIWKSNNSNARDVRF